MNINTMTETELKALAYEQVVLLEQTQANIRAIQTQLEKQKEVEKKPKEK